MCRSPVCPDAASSDQLPNCVSEGRESDSSVMEIEEAQLSRIKSRIHINKRLT